MSNAEPITAGKSRLRGEIKELELRLRAIQDAHERALSELRRKSALAELCDALSRIAGELAALIRGDQ